MPGFIAQLIGRLTKDRYHCVTVYVDHASQNRYIYLQRSTSSNETFLSKRLFESYERKNGVSVNHYHCKNSRFTDTLFIRDVQNNGQSISYSDANAHFQNSIAEKRIRDIQEYARKTILHGMAKWPEVMSSNLWSYAAQNTNDHICSIPDQPDSTSKFEWFIGSSTSCCMRNKYALFCPVYALQNQLRQQKKINKWAPRTMVGINLGISPQHTRSVSLVLNLKIGLVSPQYYVIHDDFFETVGPDSNVGITSSYWQRLAGLETEEQIKRQINNNLNRTKEITTINHGSNDTTHLQKNSSIDTTPMS